MRFFRNRHIIGSAFYGLVGPISPVVSFAHAPSLNCQVCVCVYIDVCVYRFVYVQVYEVLYQTGMKCTWVHFGCDILVCVCLYVCVCVCVCEGVRVYFCERVGRAFQVRASVHVCTNMHEVHRTRCQ